MRQILLVLSGPSGVGKGTLKERVMRGGGFEFSVSCTTRAPRSGEKDGKDYFFLGREEFEERIRRGEFLEYNEHFGNLYGTLKSFVEGRLKEISVVLDIDVVGALRIKERYPAAVLVMIVPPDKETLRARLVGRGSEDDEEIEGRLSRMGFELAQAEKFDHTIVNDDLERAAAELFEIIKQEKNKPERR